MLRTLFLGAAAVGVPALANAIIASRSRRLERPAWGHPRRLIRPEGEVAFQELGEGPSVVLLHACGPGYDAEQWRSSGERLARGRRVYALDLIGWGRSDKPRIDYDSELYLRLIEGFLEEVVREPAALVAAELPAAYALQTAADLPELVDCLALVAPTGLHHQGEEPSIGDALTNRLLRLPVLGTAALNVVTSRPVLARHLRREVFGEPDRVHAALVEHHHSSSHQPGSHFALAAYLSGYLNHRVEPALTRVEQPVWLGWGRRSKRPPVEMADMWLHRLPQAELDVFEDCGSLPHLETPGDFADRLAAFLDRAAS